MVRRYSLTTSLTGRGCGGALRRWLDHYHITRLQPVKSFRDDLLAGIKTGGNDRNLFGWRANLDRPHLGFAIATDYPGKHTGGAALQGGRRDCDDVAFGVEQHPSIDEFARPQSFVGVGEQRLEADC